MKYISDGIYTKYNGDELYSIMAKLSYDNTLVGYVRGKLCGTIDDFFKEISASLRFPSYFGWNFPAFVECMEDLDDWHCFSSILVVMEDFSQMFKGNEYEETWKSILKRELADIQKYWQENNIEFRYILNL